MKGNFIKYRVRQPKGVAVQKHNKWQIIGLCCLVYFVSYYTRKDFTAVMASLIRQNLISKATGGWIGTALFISYGIGQVFCGVLADRFSPKALLGCGLALAGICNLLMPTAITAGLAVPLWTINGFAQSFMWPPIVRILADNLDKERFVTANFLVSSSSHISTILLYLYVPLCLRFFSWQFVFFSATVLAIIALLSTVVGLSVIWPGSHTSKSKTPQATSNRNNGFLTVISSAGALPLIICIVVTGYLRDGIESWLPTLYCEAFQKSDNEAIFLSAILPVFSMVSITAITVAHRSRTFNNEALGSACLFAVAAVLCVPLCLLLKTQLSSSRFLCLILASLICGCMHACAFLLISCLPGRFSKYGVVATVSGTCNAFVYLGSAVSMYGIPAITQTEGWRGAVISWALIALIGVIFALWGKRKYTYFISH